VLGHKEPCIVGKTGKCGQQGDAGLKGRCRRGASIYLNETLLTGE
jgi:hypothetical protein